jgi:hypothetical protein
VLQTATFTPAAEVLQPETSEGAKEVSLALLTAETVDNSEATPTASRAEEKAAAGPESPIIGVTAVAETLVEGSPAEEERGSQPDSGSAAVPVSDLAFEPKADALVQKGAPDVQDRGEESPARVTPRRVLPLVTGGESSPVGLGKTAITVETEGVSKNAPLAGVSGEADSVAQKVDLGEGEKMGGSFLALGKGGGSSSLSHETKVGALEDGFKEAKVGGLRSGANEADVGGPESAVKEIDDGRLESGVKESKVGAVALKDESSEAEGAKMEKPSAVLIEVSTNPKEGIVSPEPTERSADVHTTGGVQTEVSPRVIKDSSPATSGEAPVHVATPQPVPANSSSVENPSPVLAERKAGKLAKLGTKGKNGGSGGAAVGSPAPPKKKSWLRGVFSWGSKAASETPSDAKPRTPAEKPSESLAEPAGEPSGFADCVSVNPPEVLSVKTETSPNQTLDQAPKPLSTVNRSRVAPPEVKSQTGPNHLPDRTVNPSDAAPPSVEPGVLAVPTESLPKAETPKPLEELDQGVSAQAGRAFEEQSLKQNPPTPPVELVGASVPVPIAKEEELGLATSSKRAANQSPAVSTSNVETESTEISRSTITSGEADSADSVPFFEGVGGLAVPPPRGRKGSVEQAFDDPLSSARDDSTATSRRDAPGFGVSDAEKGPRSPSSARTVMAAPIPPLSLEVPVAPEEELSPKPQGN